VGERRGGKKEYGVNFIKCMYAHLEISQWNSLYNECMLRKEIHYRATKWWRQLKFTLVRERRNVQSRTFMMRTIWCFWKTEISGGQDSGKGRWVGQRDSSVWHCHDRPPEQQRQQAWFKLWTGMWQRGTGTGLSVVMDAPHWCRVLTAGAPGKEVYGNSAFYTLKTVLKIKIY
jgi:hypothetical protein